MGGQHNGVPWDTVMCTVCHSSARERKSARTGPCRMRAGAPGGAGGAARKLQFFTRSAKDDEHAWTPGRTPLWKETRSSGARAGRDRAPISLALPAYRPARVLIDDFHHIRHLWTTAPARYRHALNAWVPPSPRVRCRTASVTYYVVLNLLSARARAPCPEPSATYVIVVGAKVNVVSAVRTRVRK